MAPDNTAWRNRIKRYGEMPADQFLANPANPRRHPNAQREVLRGSFDALGIIAPVLINARTGFMIDGHARVEECLTKDDTMLIPFIEVDLSEDEEALALASFDWITQMATYDREALDSLLREVNTDNAALQTLLSELAEQNDLYFGDAPSPVEDAGPQINRADELQAQCQVKRGDVWVIGKHRLMCGDSTNADDVARLMGGVKADMVFTDPPYNIASDGTNFAATAPNQNAYSQLKDEAWDKDFDIKTIIPNLVSFCKEKSTAYICTSHFLFGDLCASLKKHFDFVSYCVWCKSNPMPSLAKTHWTWGTELIVYATNSGHVFNFPADGHALNWWDIPQTQANRMHPTQKPVEIPTRAILHSSLAGACILDLFTGSGTTLVACEQTGRIGYGMEISEAYCAVVLERMKALGLTPRREPTHEIEF